MPTWTKPSCRAELACSDTCPSLSFKQSLPSLCKTFTLSSFDLFKALQLRLRSALQIGLRATILVSSDSPPALRSAAVFEESFKLVSFFCGEFLFFVFVFGRGCDLEEPGWYLIAPYRILECEGFCDWLAFEVAMAECRTEIDCYMWDCGEHFVKILIRSFLGGGVAGRVWVGEVNVRSFCCYSLLGMLFDHLARFLREGEFKIGLCLLIPFCLRALGIGNL